MKNFKKVIALVAALSLSVCVFSACTGNNGSNTALTASTASTAASDKI